MKCSQKKKKNSSTASCGENESSVDLSERENSCWVSMICQWVSRAICWLSQTAGDYNYPGTEGGERGACSVNRLPLLSCMDVAHSQRPHSCMSTTLFWTWLLNLFTLGVFSLCNQYSLLLRRTAGAGNGRVTRMIQTQRVFKLSTNAGACETSIVTATDKTVGITTSFCFQDRDLLRSSSAQSLSSLSTVSFLFLFSLNECSWTSVNVCF